MSVGIVVVSHSRPLAEAAVALAAQMVHGELPPIEIAAGAEDGSLGTDATAVHAAIESLAGADGILVLLDLGSAVMSAETAYELLDPDLAARVTLSSAPLVEGLFGAVVRASTGGNLATVAAEAARGLLPKQVHLDTA
ncbi:dihydroxyacetone kinase phosphoryl donor subunit DhaM [Solicola gregarius]|uniref:phosphoenolpyruvate--glycerone phosphotransferase n=1 Tax=Solicola gregarius TaxID=2908642 RepID=A0AA46THN8_9ACTN|nr:dihydroxyacetone kinase phosphoryl donor subunit DhaM [Solicola gregarius]UYM04703.1 PTS-dependent dihydroxyacetone kinase phosphotransferase subunit DhaM [Solicola gregarius]